MTDVTIVIPSYKRPDRLSRSITYWSESGFPVVIVDGSDQPLPDTDLPSNFSYFSFPGLDLATRWIKGVDAVQTPFFVFCADDDFLAFDKIRECVEFLKSHPTYSSVQGQYVAFWQDGRSVKFVRIYEPANQYRYDSDAVDKRIFASFRFYHQFLYSVQRTAQVKPLLSAFPKVTNNNAFEAYFNFANSIVGKHKIIEGLYGVREIIFNSAGAVTPCLTNWKTTDSASFREWRDFCAKQLVDFCKFDRTIATATFDNAFFGYEEFIREYRPPALHSRIGGMEKIWSALKLWMRHKLPESLVNRLKDRQLRNRIAWEGDLTRLSKNQISRTSLNDAIRIQRVLTGLPQHNSDTPSHTIS